MAWNLDEGRPIYLQLVERIQMQIVSGQYGPGEKLPSVRELAAEAAVNPNTMQRAFSELEASGLVVTQRTNGRNVTEDTQLIRDIRQRLAGKSADEFYLKMKRLGITGKELLEFLTESFEGRD